ncbi:uncharacterized protein A1O9_06782 [Exophiala aquamarina CBS 119918]|uniref:Uncharacterized protein n=1 Tax=Exophiala aquamarina CBS 119918 TaxID=1182545 RepID=A0A072PBE3_9EURO|nr:uncharacterized protein A1O9_06782 [Exophiala aquamarina CBS 119918]KEF56593.1 hypothetical protein A1O9_06782 [Exophiala aquamarina CBS 119918]
MAAFKNSILITTLLPIRHVMASPIPQIFSPEMGQLSFAELIQQSLRRILERGFVGGILYSILILGCLICALICVFCALWAILERRDSSFQVGRRTLFSDKNGTTHEASPTYKYRPQTETRLSRFVLSSPSSKTTSPATKITIRASSVRKSKTTPPSSPPPSSSSLSRSTPLRSALSKTPPSQPSTTQSFFFGSRRRSSPASSPKSVRWADDIEVSIFTTVEMKVGNDVDPDEFDLGTPITSSVETYNMSNLMGGRETFIKSRAQDHEIFPSTAVSDLAGDKC